MALDSFPVVVHVTVSVIFTSDDTPIEEVSGGRVKRAK